MLALALTCIALATATLSGMTGLGGGTILIAALYALGFAPAVAVPLHAAVQLISNGTRSLAYLPHVDWRGIGLFMIAAAPSAFVVAPLAARVDADLVRLLMAAFLVLAAWPGWLAKLRLGGAAGLVVAGFLSGGLGMLLGATGLLIAPFFLRDDWRKETVIATMAVCQAAAHLFKVLAFASIGFGIFDALGLLLPMAVAVVAGTLLGRRLVGVFDERRFRLVVRAILVILAVQLGLSGAAGLIG